jgi:hypothetical protein
MARNGAGTYNLPIGNPVTTGTTISSTWANNTLNDIATALTGSISSDGQTVVSANLPMSGYAHTGVANATIRTMYASGGQVQDGSISYLTSVSGTNAVTAVAALGMSAYAVGQRFSFLAAGTNTGATTLNINSIGAKPVTKNGTNALTGGEITSGAVVEVLYDGTEFQITSQLIPAGVIVMWSGSIVSIPSGWYLCDGNNSTPDLRNRFIVGAGSTYSVAATGGSADAIVVSHTHSASVTDPGHTHNINGYAFGASGPATIPSGTNEYVVNRIVADSNTTGISVANSTTGSSGTNANLPPYYALAYIMKA